MSYMLMIHQGDSPDTARPRGLGDALPGRAERGLRRLQGASTRRPASRPGWGWQPPQTATTVRVQDGKTLTTDGPFVETKEALNGYLLLRGRRPRRGDRAGGADPGRAARRRDRGAPDRGVVTDPRADLPRRVGSRARHADRLPRRLRPRRGGRAGGVRDRGGAVATRRRARQPRRLARHDGPQPRHRPRPPRSRAGREDPPAPHRRRRWRTTWTRRRFPTSGSSCCSPAAIRRSRSTRRSR